MGEPVQLGQPVQAGTAGALPTQLFGTFPVIGLDVVVMTPPDRNTPPAVFPALLTLMVVDVSVVAMELTAARAPPLVPAWLPSIVNPVVVSVSVPLKIPPPALPATLLLTTPPVNVAAGAAELAILMLASPPPLPDALFPVRLDWVSVTAPLLRMAPPSPFTFPFVNATPVVSVSAPDPVTRAIRNFLVEFLVTVAGPTIAIGVVITGRLVFGYADPLCTDVNL